MRHTAIHLLEDSTLRRKQPPSLPLPPPPPRKRQQDAELVEYSYVGYKTLQFLPVAEQFLTLKEQNVSLKL